MVDGGILLQNGANINTEIYNNIIINQHAWRGCIAINNTAMFTSDNNILNDKMSNKGDGSTISLAAWQALGLDTNSLLASSMNSIFADPTLKDFNLATDSQAIDTGTNLVSTIVTYDINENTRPKGINYDIGAYEFDSTLSTDNNSPIFQGIAYPNPTSGIINTKIKNLNNIILYDITGRFIKIIEPKSSIDLTELPNGIYLLKFISNEREFITRVIKE
ncbi:T9SS type A sorting domain-containing protein [Algibacter lectus]|nr:T9SS type A sorting domain-containing protein [Algibacter lectus]